jgi:probable phosphoglycerate mutase
MKVYLIRHGKSQDSEDGLSQRKDSPLSESGKQKILSLKTEFLRIPFSKIYHSPWNRAKETAYLLFGDSGLQLKEMSYLHEYQKPSHLEGADPLVVEKFWNDNLENLYRADWKPNDGESFNDILSRTKKLKKMLLAHQEEDTIGVVSHGILFRHLIGHWLIGNKYNPVLFSNLLRHIRLDNLGFIALDIDKDNKSLKVDKWHNFEGQTYENYFRK